jgi:hypothetical protein
MRVDERFHEEIKELRPPPSQSAVIRKAVNARVGIEA